MDLERVERRRASRATPTATCRPRGREHPRRAHPARRRATAIAAQRLLGGHLDVVGFVTPDESRLRRVQLRVAGWIQSLRVSRTGEVVRAGQPMLSIYSPELFQSEKST